MPRMTCSSIQIRINGEPRTVSSSLTLAELLQSLQLNSQNVVVELNRQVVARERLGEVAPGEGDEIEIVHFVGGG